ncbi:MAG: terminase [Jatrophihabitantaceae bacterium]
MPRRVGCEVPRVYTPPLSPLEPRSPVTEKRTLGYACIDFAHKDLLIKLFPWQCWLLVHMLELVPGTRRLRFRTVLVLVARQNGKSTLSVVLALFFVYMLERKLVIGTAQDLDVAEEIWQNAVNLIEELDEDDEPVRPDLYDELVKVVGANGKKALVLTRNRRYKVKAASRGAGRSLSADLVLLDELREHKTWDAWAALTKTMMAREFALTLGLSNAGDAASIVLRYLRTMAHLALGNPDRLDVTGLPRPTIDDQDELTDAEVDERIAELEEQFEDDLAIFEWSTPPGMSTSNRDGWPMANPSMNQENGIAERSIASAQRTDPEHIFRCEVLCQMSDTYVDGPFPEGAWEACLDEESTIEHAGVRKVGIDVSANHSFAYIAVAALNQHGVPHVEVAATRAGTDWVLPWLQERGIREVALQGKGAPVSALRRELEDAVDEDGNPAPITVVGWEGSELASGTGKFFEYVRDAKLVHLIQPIVDLAAATAATKPLGDGAWCWNRNASPHDIAGLVAETAAFWLLMFAPQVQVAEPRIRMIGGRA